MLNEAEFVNVMDHGAVGDGVVDDADAIQRAFDEAYATGRGVWFPLETYLISKPIRARGRLARAVAALKRALK